MPTLEEVKAQIKKDWTENSAAWKKWNAPFTAMTRGVTEALVEAAALEPGMRVLDLASGTGEPALTLARKVGPKGRVVATDLVPQMLEMIRRHADEQRLGNVDVEPADMESLQFGDASFPRVTSRFGIMFPPDTKKALSEIKRVLQPGGRAAFVVWGPPTQPFFELIGIFNAKAKLPPPPPEAPTPFRFAKPGSLSAALREAGFRDTSEEPRSIPWNFPGSADEFWKMQLELVPQMLERFRAALSPADFDGCLKQAFEGVKKRESGGQVQYDAQVYVVTAVKHS